jgi:uncharacterized damage-inducible protein DinB
MNTHTKLVLALLIVLFTTNSMTSQDTNQEQLPYYQIPDYPESYTPGTVIARMIDGLGFRYYWATEGLTEKDLAFKPSETNRTIGETIDHIYGLTRVIHNSAIKEPNDRTKQVEETLTFEEKRARTLKNLKESSTIFLTSKDINEHLVIFISQRGTNEYPFWNQINGPIEDAVWHCGQVVALRRAAGNPFDSNVSVFQGKRREN